MSEPVESPAGEAAEAPVVVADTSSPIVATAGRYYRNARFIMVLGLIVMGGYFLYDGYVGYPKKNAQIADVQQRYNAATKDTPEWFELEQMQRKLGAPHQATDIALQKVLGFALPVAALAYMAFFLRKSRGEIRWEDDTLHVPGHSPVSVAAVKSVDSRQWKKKGIAVVHYDLAGRGGAFTLDDFVYQQTPVDAIYDRLVARTTPVAPAPAEDA